MVTIFYFRFTPQKLIKKACDQRREAVLLRLNEQYSIKLNQSHGQGRQDLLRQRDRDGNQRRQEQV